MCGFCGVIHWDGEPVAPEQLRTMIQRIRYRGPDEAFIARPSPEAGFAHARLRVIDLTSEARQPMASADGHVWLLFNGEIYNFLELRTELAAAGHTFRSRSDTEVALRSYEAWGADAVRRWDGMFAIALWDIRRGELLLARDRTGKKPLFYWTDGRCLAFGSEIKALLAHTHVPCALEEAQLPFLLTFGYSPEGESCYRAIRQVPPAAVVRVCRNATTPQTQTYWDVDFTPTRATLSVEDAREELRRRLIAAVRRRLIADVPLGAFLSGGIDSSIIVSLMARLMSGERVKTFSVGFAGDVRFNETHHAQQVAARWHTDHTVFTVTPQSFELVERLVWHHDQPFGDSSAIPTYLISQRTREQVTVALCGDGGDEVFAGYPRFLAGVYSERLPRALVTTLQHLLRRLPAGHDRALLARAKRFVAAAALPLPARFFRWLTYCGGALPWWHQAPPEAMHPVHRRWWERSASWSTLSRLLYLNLKDYLANDLLVKADRCSMAHGLEVRSPFLDTAVIEFAASLPDHAKLRGLRTKWLLRAAFAEDVPREILQRRDKMGFSIPLGTWLRDQWRAPLRDYLDAPDARLYRYVPRATVQQSLHDHLRGQADYGHRLWLLLTCEIWLRQREALAAGRTPVALCAASDAQEVSMGHP